VVLRHKPRAFVESLDFVTAVGYGRGGGSRARLGYHGAGPTAIITDLGVLRPDPETGEFTLASLHQGVTVAQAKEVTGWDLKVAQQLDTTEPPTGRSSESYATCGREPRPREEGRGRGEAGPGYRDGRREGSLKRKGARE
jgi:glutaconate CoA-transferase subunit B